MFEVPRPAGQCSSSFITIVVNETLQHVLQFSMFSKLFKDSQTDIPGNNKEKIEVLIRKTKNNPKKYYWILNSKEPTPSFLKYYLFTLALFPSTLHFSMAKSTGPQLLPPQTPSGRTACFTTPSPRGIHKDQQQNAIREGGWVYDCLSTFPSYPFVAFRLAGWNLKWTFHSEELDFYDWANGGWGEGSHDILVSSYRDSPQKVRYLRYNLSINL